MKTYFESDIKEGRLKELIFKNYFLGFLGIAGKDVTADPDYRQADIDIVTKDFDVDIKTLSFKNYIIIEDYTNCNKELGEISKGWFYKSKASLIAYVFYDKKNVHDKDNGLIIILRFDQDFKAWYEANKDKYQLIVNKVSERNNGKKWQSAYRKLPFSDLSKFIAYFKVKVSEPENLLQIVYLQKELP